MGTFATTNETFMIDPITIEDMDRISEQAMSMDPNGEVDLAELFTSWSLDPDAIKQWAMSMAALATADINNGESPTFTFFTTLVGGIEMGYKLRLEVEMRESASSQD